LITRLFNLDESKLETEGVDMLDPQSLEF